MIGTLDILTPPDDGDRGPGMTGRPRKPVADLRYATLLHRRADLRRELAIVEKRIRTVEAHRAEFDAHFDAAARR